MERIDWLVVGVVVAFIGTVIWSTRRYSTSVSGFLAADRCAGRYLLCISQGMAVSGAVGIIGGMQVIYNVGFAASWWNNFSAPIMMFLTLSGWIIYRYRQTRVLTMGQFFEIRYGRNFRIFAGFLTFFSGVVNFGVWPAIGADFFMAYCGLPSEIWGIPFYPILLIFLISASYFTLIGGQITVLVSDFIQGMFFNLTMFTIMVVILIKFDFGDIFTTLAASPEGKSMVNPLDIAGNKGYTIWYFVINVAMMVYGYKCWQADSGYNCSARNAHEAKMAGVLGSYRWWGFLVCLTLLPLCAYVIMHNPDFSSSAALINAELSQVANPEVRNQLTTPIAMKQFVPSGLLGCFAASIFAAFIGSVGSQLHSWGSILIQDAILPLKKKNLSPEVHIKWLRLSMLGVAVFVFIFSLLYSQTQRMQLFFMVSGAIFISGAGIVIVGGLYWSRGTAAGAWSAMISGALVAIVGMIFEQAWIKIYGTSFPLDYKWIAVIAMAVSSFVYILVSLIQNKPAFNMDKMLHRGPYAIDKEGRAELPERWSLKSIFGITKDFSLGDKLIYAYSFSWSWFMCGLAIVITTIAVIWGISNSTWARIYMYLLSYLVIISFGIAVWLTTGGFKDLFRLFRDLKSATHSEIDDGRVEENKDSTCPNTTAGH